MGRNRRQQAHGAGPQPAASNPSAAERERTYAEPYDSKLKEHPESRAQPQPAGAARDTPAAASLTMSTSCTTLRIEHDRTATRQHAKKEWNLIVI